MIGERVDVYRREQVSLDALGEPEYIWTVEHVDNVLVRPVNTSSTADISDAERPDGMRITYILGFPKTYSGSLAHCKIVLADRGMVFEDALDVDGSPDYLKPCPTAWNMLVNVGRVDG